jgi:hypothetical protein
MLTFSTHVPSLRDPASRLAGSTGLDASGLQVAPALAAGRRSG